MGLKDNIEGMKDKGKDMAGQHGDKVTEGIDRAESEADKRTGGKHSDRIKGGADRMRESVPEE